MHGQAKTPVCVQHIEAQNKLRKSVMLLRSFCFFAAGGRIRIPTEFSVFTQP